MLNFARIRSRREKLGLSQKELAGMTGIRTDILSRIENGHRVNPTLTTMERLAQGLQLKVADIITEPKKIDSL